MGDKLYRHHGKPCYWCKRPMMRESTALRPTRDHIIPQAKGGREIVICCHACNQLKADMHPAMWLMMLAKRPVILERFGRPGPRGMALFYDVFGAELAPYGDKIAEEAMGLFPQFGEVKL